MREEEDPSKKRKDHKSVLQRYITGAYVFISQRCC